MFYSRHPSPMRSCEQHSAAQRRYSTLVQLFFLLVTAATTCHALRISSWLDTLSTIILPLRHRVFGAAGNTSKCLYRMSGEGGCRSGYSQTSLIRSSFIRIPRHPEENRWLPIYGICHAHIQYVYSIIRSPRLSGYFVENGCVRLSEV